MYLKITNAEETHHGIQYHNGLNIDQISFSQEGSCCPGGIYFTTPKYICNFLDMGHYIREVVIPEDAEMVQDPQGNKWRSSKVVLAKKKDLRKPATWKWLVENGVDIHAYNDYALIYAAGRGYFEVVKYLIKAGADIHTRNDYVFREASYNGHEKIVKYLEKQCQI